MADKDAPLDHSLAPKPRPGASASSSAEPEAGAADEPSSGSTSAEEQAPASEVDSASAATAPPRREIGGVGPGPSAETVATPLPAQDQTGSRIEDGAPRQPASPAAEERVAPGPDRIGRFRLDRVVGSGGMGVVYMAWDEDLQRRVAVKVLAPGLSNQLALERFQQEATLAARLQHPNIVAIYEAGEVDGRAFIAMELVEGATLEGVIDAQLGDAARLEGDEREEARRVAAARMGSQQLQDVCRWVRDIARALHCGHTYTAPDSDELAPIIHRDVKPGNIMVDARGQARLLDFGLAKEMGVALTVTREALGTPLYMSPEQLFSARRVGPRSDVYSLGMTLYACVTLARPFELSNPGQLFEHLMHDEPVDPGRLHIGLPAELRTIILEAIAKDERRRYASAEALADDLDAYLSGRPIKARPPGLARRLSGFARRRWKPLTAAAISLVASVGFALDAKLERERTEGAQIAAEVEAEAARKRGDRAARDHLVEAGMLYGLAALSKGEDPEGARWLELLNQGHDREQKASKVLREVGINSLQGENWLLSLRARIARNDREALEELRARDAKLSRSTKGPAARSVLAWLPRRVELDPERFHDALLGAAVDPKLMSEAEEVLALLGEGSVASLLGGPGEEPRPGLERLLEVVNGVSARAARDEALRARLADVLREIQHTSRVAVSMASSAQGWERARVSIVPYVPGQAPVAPLTSGALGEVLELDAFGDFLVLVTNGERELRLPLRLSRYGWGQQRPIRRLKIPELPADAPREMLLAVGEGAAFLVDPHEVTVAEYRRFLEGVAGRGHASCPDEERSRYPGGKDHTPGPSPLPAADGDPVTGVDHYDAEAYAAWAKKRLPTAAEWEVAARGIFPLHTVGANLRGVDDGYVWAAPSDAGHLAPCGARGLVGNVAEWLAWEDHDLSFRNAAGLGWSERADLAPADVAGALSRFDPEARGADLGFRCVLSLPEPDVARAPAERITSERDGAALVLVQGGAYALKVGRRRKRAPGEPGAARREPREFVLPAFYVDRDPVSIGRYRRYLVSFGRELPPSLRGRDLELPVTGVTWEEAQAYAAWAGRRLCAEVEWLAAREVGAFQAQEVVGSPQKRSGRAEAHLLPEWCADTWHPRFLLYANRRAPLNRWTPTGGHVVRRGDKRGHGAKYAIGFRTALRAQPGGDE